MLLFDRFKLFIIKLLNIEVYNTIVFDDFEGNIQRIQINRNDIYLIETYHHYPRYELKEFTKYCNNVIYIPDDTKIKQIKQIENLKDLKRSFNQKIDKLIINMF